MRSSIRRALPLVGLLTLVPSTVRSDEKVVVLRNGRRITGEVVSESPDTLTVKTDGGTVTLPRAQVARLDEPPPVERPRVEPPRALEAALPVVPAAPAPATSTAVSAFVAPGTRRDPATAACREALCAAAAATGPEQ